MQKKYMAKKLGKFMFMFLHSSMFACLHGLS